MVVDGGEESGKEHRVIFWIDGNVLNDLAAGYTSPGLPVGC